MYLVLHGIVGEEGEVDRGQRWVGLLIKRSGPDHVVGWVFFGLGFGLDGFGFGLL